MTTTHRALIALVDDDTAILQALGSLLRAERYDVLAFLDAESFLASEQRHACDCVIVDLHMKGMGGLGLLQQGLGIPSIVLTAHADEATRAACARAGAHVVLLKPPVARRLLVAISEALPSD